MHYRNPKGKRVRIIFLLWDLYSESFGPLQLASFLKNYNYEVLLCEARVKNISNLIREGVLNILALSLPTAYVPKALKFAAYFKGRYPNILTIAGGPHPTLCPEFIYNEGIDIICRGEGEYAMLELLQRLERGDDITDIKNLWVKHDGKVFKNELRPLITNLDELPFPDRSCYHKFYPSLLKRMAVIFSRGCIFNCAFCLNSSVRRLYGVGPNDFFRIRSPASAVEEMEYLRNTYGCREFFIHDDIFGYDIEWLKLFARYYRERVGLPFHCNMHASYVTEERLKYLKDANCNGITMGVESGSDYVRNKIFKKGVTSEGLIEAAEKIHKYGISLRTTAIFGCPGNTINDEWGTVALNIKCRPKVFRAYFLSFYPGFSLCHRGHVYEWSQDKFIAHSDGSDITLWPHSKYYDKIIYLAYIIVNFPSLFSIRNLLMRLPLRWAYMVCAEFLRLNDFVNFIQKHTMSIFLIFASALFFIVAKIKNIQDRFLLMSTDIVGNRKGRGSTVG